MRMVAPAPCIVLMSTLLAACMSDAGPVDTSTIAPTAPVVESTTTLPTPTTGATSTAPSTTTTTVDRYAPPEWLGSRVLPLDEHGFGEVRPTPDELEARAIRTVDILPPPPAPGFTATTGPVPEDVVARSTWHPGCPVGLDELAYLTVTHWGFDGVEHTGELIVNASVAEGMVGVFARLHDLRFPIEQMRVIRLDELDAPPTGDGNETTSFVCRPAVGSGSWSMHASGLAIDINPFHNPYQKGEVVLPELASAFVDRSWARPGMVTPDVVAAFAEIGWAWGGEWTSLKDWMHFSSNNR